jgi:protein AroM
MSIYETQSNANIPNEWETVNKFFVTRLPYFLYTETREMEGVEMTNRLGIITIGQAPRVDMVPEMRTLLPDHIEVIEKGAIDDFSSEDLLTLAPKEGDITLVSRLKNGEAVTVSERAILPLLQEKISLLEEMGTTTTIIACTGTFPPFKSKHPLLYPDRVLTHFVSGILPHGKLGIIVPLPEQIAAMREKWERPNLQLAFTAASPYDKGTDFEYAGRVLQEQGVDVIVLDCMGYSVSMKERVKNVVNVPVILSRSVVARAAAEMVS